MTVTKVHAVGSRLIGNQAMTACNSYMAEGQYAVAVVRPADDADVREHVTCVKCLRALDEKAKA